MDLAEGTGEVGEVHWIREHTEAMEQRLERIEALLREQGAGQGPQEADTAMSKRDPPS